MATGIENAGVNPPKKINMNVEGEKKQIGLTAGEKEFLKGAGEMGLAFLPGSGEAISAKDYFRDYKQTVKNIKEGKPLDAATSGIMAFLAGVGMLPVVGYGPRILRKGLQKGKDVYDAFRASRKEADLDAIANPEANEIEDLGTTMLPVIQESRAVEQVLEPTTTVYKMGDTDVPTGMMQDDVPFYSRGLEVLDNIDYNEFIKTGNVKRIRQEKTYKDEALPARLWLDLFQKNDVPMQELDETGVNALLRSARETGTPIKASDIRNLLVQNPVRNVKVTQYGGPRNLPLDLDPEMGVLDTLYREGDLIDQAQQTYRTPERIDGELVNSVYMIMDSANTDWVRAIKAYTRAPTNDAVKRRLVDQTIVMNNSAKEAKKLIDRSIKEAQQNPDSFNTISLNAEYIPAMQKQLDGIITKTEESPFISWPKISEYEYTGPTSYLEPRHERSGYNIPGGTEYGEFVFTAPTPKGQAGKEFSQHFPGEINPIAHVRFDSRKIIDDPNSNIVDANAGDDVLLIQEIQSDIHQGARTKGMNPNTDASESLKGIKEEMVGKIDDARADKLKEFYKLSQTPFGELTEKDVRKLKILSQDIKRGFDAKAGLSVNPQDQVFDDQMPFMPLQGNMAWGDYTVKYMANKALQGGKKWLAIAPAEWVSIRGSGGTVPTDTPKLGDANFYGTSDLRTIKAEPKSGDPRYDSDELANVDTSQSVIPKIFDKLSKIDPSREPLKVATITINGPGGDPIKVLALQIDDRFDRAFTLYKREGGIVTLPITWYK